MLNSALIVDDDDVTRRDLRELLLHEGLAVVACASASDALDVLHTRVAPGVIIIELMLHDAFDGWDFLKEKAADRAIARIPVIVASEHGRVAAPIRDVVATLRKPCNPGLLLRALRGLRPTDEELRRRARH